MALFSSLCLRSKFSKLEGNLFGLISETKKLLFRLEGGLASMKVMLFEIISKGALVVNF